MKLQYSILIQWSDEDQVYLVTLPEFGANPQTHGESYKEAMKRALEVIESLVDLYRDEQWPLPEPRKYGAKKKPRSNKRKNALRPAGTAKV